MHDLMQRPDIPAAPTIQVPAGELTAEHLGQHVTVTYCGWCNEHVPATEAAAGEHAHADVDGPAPVLEAVRLQLAGVAHERYATTLTVALVHLGPTAFAYDHGDPVTITRPVSLPAPAPERGQP